MEGKKEGREGPISEALDRGWSVPLEKLPKSTPGPLPLSALILKGHHTPALIAPGPGTRQLGTAPWSWNPRNYSN